MAPWRWGCSLLISRSAAVARVGRRGRVPSWPWLPWPCAVTSVSGLAARLRLPCDLLAVGLVRRVLEVEGDPPPVAHRTGRPPPGARVLEAGLVRALRARAARAARAGRTGRGPSSRPLTYSTSSSPVLKSWCSVHVRDVDGRPVVEVVASPVDDDEAAALDDVDRLLAVALATGVAAGGDDDLAEVRAVGREADLLADQHRDRCSFGVSIQTRSRPRATIGEPLDDLTRCARSRPASPRRSRLARAAETGRHTSVMSSSVCGPAAATPRRPGCRGGARSGGGPSA